MMLFLVTIWCCLPACASYGTGNHSKCDGNCNTSKIMTAHEMDQMKYDITAILGKNRGEN